MKLDRIQLMKDNLIGYLMIMALNLFLFMGTLLFFAGFYFYFFYITIPAFFIIEFVLWYWFIPYTIVAIDDIK